MEFSNYLLEKLAEAAHEIFCEDLRAKDYKYGPVTRDDLKEHSSLKPFYALPEDEKEQNRNNVRDIPDKLASVGYNILAARSVTTPAQFSDEEVEKLAKREHERWVKEKLNNGWKYGPETDKPNKVHKDLVSWEQLSNKDRGKDRALIRGIPQILARAGYTMAKMGEPPYNN